MLRGRTHETAVVVVLLLSVRFASSSLVLARTLGRSKPGRSWL